MIIRSLRLRHGRLALPKSTPLRRCLSTAPQRRQDLSAQHLARDQPDPSLPLDASSLPSGIRTDIRDPTHPVAQNYILRAHNQGRTAHLGAAQENIYKPHDLLANPPKPEDITLELLLASQTHIGHATSLWHPANAKYIFGIRGDHDPIHIISLDTTAAYLRRACKVVQGVAERGGLILFVGTRTGQARTVVKAAQMAKGCHLFSRWTPGSITNGQQILGQCRKKVVNERDEEILGFQDQLEYKSAIKPDLVVCLNPLDNYILLHECGLHNVPTIGIIDTDANPTWVTYPIPANDDSMRSVGVIAGALGRAGEAGQAARLKAARGGQINYFSTHGLKPPTAGQAQKEREALEREAQEEQAYVDEGEVLSAEQIQLLEMEVASQMGDGQGDILDGGIEGAGEGMGGMSVEGYREGETQSEGSEYAADGQSFVDQYADLTHEASVGGVDGSNEVDIRYDVDRSLSEEEMRQAAAEAEKMGQEQKDDGHMEDDDAQQFGSAFSDGESMGDAGRDGEAGKRRDT